MMEIEIRARNVDEKVERELTFNWNEIKDDSICERINKLETQITNDILEHNTDIVRGTSRNSSETFEDIIVQYGMIRAKHTLNFNWNIDREIIHQELPMFETDICNVLSLENTSELLCSYVTSFYKSTLWAEVKQLVFDISKRFYNSQK